MQPHFANRGFQLKPKSKKDLAGEYDVHRNTIAAWCEALGIKASGRLSVMQLLQIYTHYGIPGDYEMVVTV